MPMSSYWDGKSITNCTRAHTHTHTLRVGDNIMSQYDEGGLQLRGAKSASPTQVSISYSICSLVWRQIGVRGKGAGLPTMAARHGGGTPAATPGAW